MFRDTKARLRDEGGDSETVGLTELKIVSLGTKTSTALAYSNFAGS